MAHDYIFVDQSISLQGEVGLYGAKNAVLVIMASLLLTRGKSTLKNIPQSADVLHMTALLTTLGAHIVFEAHNHTLHVDTTEVKHYEVAPEIMNKMRASILVMGPLLARFQKAKVALPGGCVIGARPIDFHLKGFKKLGISIVEYEHFLEAHVQEKKARTLRVVLEYPSVGATENILMYSVLGSSETIIVNAALEPEVLDLVSVLQKMGASIFFEPAATIRIKGVNVLHPIEHEVVADRLEAGALLLAVAMTGGELYLPSAHAYAMDCFLEKLIEMGHYLEIGPNGTGIRLKACCEPRAVSFKTGPYPGFPTDLQAPMMAAQCIATGTSTIEETVFENRMMHAQELRKLGAQITVEGSRAVVRGVEKLYGTNVIASDIRASCALVLAGLVAEGTTTISGLRHWRRGYHNLEKKLTHLGGKIGIITHPTSASVDGVNEILI